ncbi:hypothetical protein [Paenibacillus camerounensis]|uniref:hypothetical protein n=1 Tax=Paenibacillus camerounensis TaxID=1243663 RepID=UPI0005A8B2C5|nr:hypothetical protein [Paenibacillus camerounensis]
MTAQLHYKLDNPYAYRQREIIRNAASEALELPLQDSGLWFHDDVRNNFYYACYLFAAAVDDEMLPESDREPARQKAEAVLLETVLLQNRQPETHLYGHWPLGLGLLPREAAPHELPVEIMGSLLVWFCKYYKSQLSAALRVAVHTATGHIYRSGFFRKEVVHYGHHEAKYTAAKLIFGQVFEDEELRQDGLAGLKQTLDYIKNHGMPEYGSLPWFWHWVQAFTCAWELEEDSAVRAALSEMLDHLWHERAAFYLRGAWVGAHSRGWPHDVPADRNVLHDYVQFGNFPLSRSMPRTEYAGFLFYEAPAQARERALDRRNPIEVQKLTQKVVPGDAQPQPHLHSYAYITEEYAAGGLWERVEEFDNEQLRWAYSLPVSAEGDVNRLFFFHPGEGYRAGDPRHQSPYMEVLYYKGTVLSLFPVPEGTDNPIVGVLPEGEWQQQEQAVYGLVKDVYFAVWLSHAYQLVSREGYLEVTASVEPGAVAVEAVTAKEAAAAGLYSLTEFADAMSARKPAFTVGAGGAEAALLLAHTTFTGDLLRLEAGTDHGTVAAVNGSPVSFGEYKV